VEIGNYIKQLLLEHQRVILPGFGNLVLEESGLGLSETGDKISPPGLTIKFDASFSKDDEKLTSRFAEGAVITKEEAKQQVLEFIDRIRFTLDKGETFRIKGLGLFYRDDDQKVCFDVDTDWIIDPEKYGLESIELLELENETIEAEGKNTEEPLLTGESESSGKKANKWRIIWILVASLIFILAVVMLIPVKEEKGTGIKFGREGIIIKRPGTGKQSAESVSEKIEEDIITVSPEEIKEITEEESIDEDKDKKVEQVVQNKYFIVAGSFSKLQNAIDMQDRLKAEGYPSEIIITENRLYRVSLFGYPTKSEALRQLDNVTKNKQFENSWVMAN